MTKFECTRDGQTRSFGTFMECEAFVMHRSYSPYHELWSFIGEAQRLYESLVEATFRVDEPEEITTNYAAGWDENR